MDEASRESWSFSRRVNLTMVVQILLLASLIVGSWVNLQRQLGLLQCDVSQLLKNQKKFGITIRRHTDKLIAHEYRLRAIEEKPGDKENEKYQD